MKSTDLHQKWGDGSGAHDFSFSNRQWLPVKLSVFVKQRRKNFFV
jgi:hypothetical protein